MPYTPGQVSEMLDIPPSSLRRLAIELKDFLSHQKGRHRRYTEGDINTLRRVRELTGQGYTLARIKQELSIVEEPQQGRADSLSLVPTIAGKLARMDDLYRGVMSDLDTLRADHENDRARLQKLERWAALPWWKRLFSKPPI